MGTNRDNFTFRLDSELRSRLTVVGAPDDRSLSYVIHQCVEDYLPILENAELRSRLKSVAGRDDRSISYILAKCLEGYLPVIEANTRQGQSPALNEKRTKSKR
jgi:predicted transcriptional regulator